MQRRTLFLNLIATVFLAAGLVACQPGTETLPPDGQSSQQAPTNQGSPTRAPQNSGKPTQTILPSLIQSQWAASPHAHTYVVDQLGTNSTCALCHAPLDFVPSMDNIPESCSACKFTVPPAPPTIAEANWKSIPCNVCHRVKKKVVQPEFAWLSIPPIDEYEDLETTTDLCLKCHGKTDLAGHGMSSLANAHANYTCTQCHDAHTTTATCSSGACHTNVLKPTVPIPGHDLNHKSVTCWACHDASGMKVGPADQGIWTTFLKGTSTAYASHNIVKQAKCDRCHFQNNPWNLSKKAP